MVNETRNAGFSNITLYFRETSECLYFPLDGDAVESMAVSLHVDETRPSGSPLTSRMCLGSICLLSRCQFYLLHF